MGSEKFRHLLNGELKPYINRTEIARASGESKQRLNYWLESGTSKPFPIRKGISKLKMLCLKIKSSKQIDPDDFNHFKKFTKMSALSKEFCGCSSSTMAVTIKRKDVNFYEKEIKDMAQFILSTLNKNVKNSKSVDIKIKLP